MSDDFVGDTMSGATFDPERMYRYALWRRFHDGALLSEMAAFVGLNPSTADEFVDDPTIRRCVGFARKWGRSGIVMLNLFAFRATDPKAMKSAADPVGPDNDEAIRRVTEVCHPVVCCWGNHGSHRDRSFVVRGIVSGTCKRSCFHFGKTKLNQPVHPLYLPADAELIRW